MLTYPFNFHYTSAIVCRVASSLSDLALSQRDIREVINIERARRQHQEYIITLRLVFIYSFMPFFNVFVFNINI